MKDDAADHGPDRGPDLRPEQRRSALPWPDPVRRGPGRWTLVASAAVMVALLVVALAVVFSRM